MKSILEQIAGTVGKPMPSRSRRFVGERGVEFVALSYQMKLKTPVKFEDTGEIVIMSLVELRERGQTHDIVSTPESGVHQYLLRRRLEQK